LIGIADQILRPWIRYEDLQRSSPDQDDRYKMVVYRIQDSNGEWRCDRRHTDGTLYEPEGVIDRATGIIYNNDPPDAVVFKCFLLTIANPIRFGISAVYNLGMAVYTFALEIFAAIKNIAFCRSCKPDFTATKNHLWYAARIPYYLIGMELCALKGWIESIITLDGHRAYRARQFFGYLEWHWNDRVSVYSDDARYNAQCFQPRASTEFRYPVINRQKYHVMSERPAHSECRAPSRG